MICEETENMRVKKRESIESFLGRTNKWGKKSEKVQAK